MKASRRTNGPDFLGIGGQRAGSTWLYDALRSHPDVWMPPLKELHYFDELRQEGYFCRRFKNQMRSRLRSWRREPPTLAQVAWVLRYMRWPRTDSWYASLFAGRPERATGEITPAYGILNDQGIRAIREINPSLKIILIMRDPIDRSWSQARKDLPRVFGCPLNDIPQEKVFEWFRSHHCYDRSNYHGIIESWLRHFPREQLFIGFFEDVQADPRDLLGRISAFLEIRPFNHFGSDIESAKNQGATSEALPDAYAREVARLHHDNLRHLAGRVGGPAESWLRRTEQLVR